MSQFEKLLIKLFNNPSDLTLSDLDKILRNYGFEKRSPKGGSSHTTYYHKDIDDIITLTSHNPQKKAYLLMVQTAIKKIEEKENED